MIVRELVTLLRYKVDESGLKKDAQNVQSWWRRVVGLGRAASDGWRQGVRGVLNEYGLVPGQVMRGILQQRRLNREQRESAKNVKAVGGQYTALAGAIRNLFGAYLGFEGISRFINAGDEFGQVEARLKNATSSYGEFIAVDKELAANSRESFKPFAANAELFIRTNDVMKALGKTTRDTLDVVSATNLSLAASGATADKSSSFIDQFSKDLGLGALSANGFNSMVANNQRMLKYLVDGLKETNPALGATMANFQKLVKEGKITTDVMIPALRSQMAKMRKDVEDMPVSMGDAVTVFRDKMARVSWELEKQHGVIRKLTTALGFLGDNLREILHLMWLVGMSWGFMRLQGGVAAMLSKLRAAGGAMAVLAAAFRKSLWPLLRMMAIFETIRLIGGDVYGWFLGYDSVLGDIIGDSSKWQSQIDWIRAKLEIVKNLLGGGGQNLGEWITKFGIVAVLATGLLSILWRIGKPIIAMGGFLLRWLVMPILSAIAAVIGWPAILGIALAAMVALVIAKFDVIRDFINGVWDSVTGYFSKKWAEALNWLEGKLKAVMPEGWVLSKEDAAKQLEDVGKKLNPYAGQMGSLQRPQSNHAPSQNNSIVNNTTINANTDNPAALANAAGQAVGRATDRAIGAQRTPPNVEALA